MFKRKNRRLLGMLVKGAGTAIAMGLGAWFVSRLRSRNSPIPEAIEARIDQVIETLNHKFGQRWVNRGLETLQTELESQLPKPLLGLVEIVHRIEHLAEQEGWKSVEKRTHAAEMIASAEG